jgi:iron-sulfur cluster assembly protein
MIEITPEAAAQIKLSMQDEQNSGLTLRIAATRNDDNSIHYGMGFDETKESDISVSSSGVDLIISPISESLLKDTKLDYVEIEDGKPQFIFLNPNDPEYTPPTKS